MALDMGHDTRRDWFGFSRPVIVAAAIAVLAAGGVAWKARASSGGYVEGLVRLCANAEQQMLDDFKSREVADKSGMRPLLDFSDTVFHAFERSIGRRLNALRAVRPPAEYAATHAELVAGEQRALDVASGYARRIEGTRTVRGVTEAAREMVAVVAEQDARYRALGVPKGCAD